MLARVMQFLTSVVAQPFTCFEASISFLEVCQCNRNALSPFSEDLLKSKVYPVAAVSLGMPEGPRESILEGVGWVLLQSDTEEQLRSRLEEFCAPFANRLNKLAGDLASSTTDDTVIPMQTAMLTEVQGILSIFGTLFKSSLTTSSSPAVVYFIFNQVWPFVVYFARNFGSSEELIEKVLRIVKHSMRKCRELFASQLTDIVSLITLGFSSHPFSAYLYTAEQLVRTYGNETTCFEMLSSLFLTLTQTATRVLSSFQAIQENPEITEDFFGMVVRYINYCPPAVLQSTALSSIIHCAKLGIGIEQADAANCLYGFISKLLTFADETSINFTPMGLEDIKQQFADIEILVVRALVKGMPRIVVESIIDLLVCIQKVFAGERWLVNAVLTEIPHDCMTDLEKMKMLEEASYPDRLKKALLCLNRRAHMRAKRSKK